MNFRILILLLPIVFAYDGWMLLDENVTVGEYNFKLAGSAADRDSLFLRMNGTSLVLAKGDEQSHLGYRLLYENARPNSTYNQDLPEVHNSREAYRFHLIIDKISSSVIIKRSAPARLQFGAILPVTLEITNNGQLDYFMKYRESVPSYYKVEGDMEIIGQNHSEELGMTLLPRWQGSLKAGESVKIYYLYRNVGFVSGSSSLDLLPGSLNYSGDDGDKSVEVPVTKIELIEPVSVYQASKPAIMRLGQEGELIVSLVNNYNASVLVREFRLKVSDGFRVKTKPIIMESSEGAYTWDGTISPNSSRDFEFDVTAVGSGKSSSAAFLSLAYGDYKQSFERSLPYTVSMEDLQVMLDVNDTDLSSYDSFSVNFTLYNPNKGEPMKQLHYELDGDMFEKVSGDVLNLDYNSYYALKPLVLQIPWMPVAGKTLLYLNGTYMTSFGELKSFSLNRTLTVKPIERVLVWIESITALTDNITVDLAVKLNIMETNLTDATIRVKDSKDRTIKKLDFTEKDLTEIKLNRNSTVHVLVPANNTVPYQVEISYNDGNNTYYSNKSVSGASYSVNTQKPQIINQSQTFKEPEKNDLLEAIQASKYGSIVSAVGISIVIILVASIIFLLRPRKVAPKAVEEAIEKAEEPERQEEAVPKPGTSLEGLQAYIERKYADGMKKDEIRALLLSQGWLTEIIDVYLK